MALDGDGLIQAVTVHVDEDLGAYPLGGIGGTMRLVGMSAGGPYRVPRFGFTATSYFTNTCPKAPYRGPWAIETIAREQMIDHVARELDLDPLELRRRNIVTPDDLPYTMASGLPVDGVTPSETLEMVVDAIDWDAFRAEQAAARAVGRYLGVGVSVCIEPSAVAMGPLATEEAIIRIDPGGKVLVLMGTGSHGHSLETTIPQVVADHLGCDIDDVLFMQGDTDATPWGAGTGGSRSAVIAGGAAQTAARRMNEVLRRLGAHVLEAATDDIEVVGGASRCVVHRREPCRSPSWPSPRTSRRRRCHRTSRPASRCGPGTPQAHRSPGRTPPTPACARSTRSPVRSGCSGSSSPRTAA